MSEHSGPSPLDDRRFVTLILRVVLDGRGLIDHGELVDVEGTVQSRFSGWRGLVAALRTWRDRQQ